jgi:hypothetical protein
MHTVLFYLGLVFTPQEGGEIAQWLAWGFALFAVLFGGRAIHYRLSKMFKYNHGKRPERLPHVVARALGVFALACIFSALGQISAQDKAWSYGDDRAFNAYNTTISITFILGAICTVIWMGNRGAAWMEAGGDEALDRVQDKLHAYRTRLLGKLSLRLRDRWHTSTMDRQIKQLIDAELAKNKTE